MCDFRCNMSRGWCFSGTSFQLRFYTSVGTNSCYNNINNYLCVLKISPLDRSTSQSNQNPTCDDNNNIEYFYSIICGDLGDGKDDEDWGAERARLGEIMVNIWWRTIMMKIMMVWRWLEEKRWREEIAASPHLPSVHNGVQMIRREDMLIGKCSLSSPSLWAFLFTAGPRISRCAPGKDVQVRWRFLAKT